MEESALIKSRVNLNRVNLGIALISDLKVVRYQDKLMCNSVLNLMISQVMIE